MLNPKQPPESTDFADEEEDDEIVPENGTQEMGTIEKMGATHAEMLNQRSAASRDKSRSFKLANAAANKTQESSLSAIVDASDSM